MSLLQNEPDRDPPKEGERPLLAGLLLAASGAVFSAWCLRLFLKGPTRVRVGSVAELGALGAPKLELAAAAIGFVLVGLAARRARWPRSPVYGFGGLALVLTAIASSVESQPSGPFLAIAVASLGIAGLVSVLPLPELKLPDRAVAAVLFAISAGAAAIYSIHRFESFGAGSWDLGCMVHNFYRASRFLDTRSTVLGDVDFLGDHFMVGIYLYAPLVWISSSARMLLLIQALNVGASAPSIYLIARRRGLGVPLSVVLGLATGFSFGLQSAAYFDAHEISVGIGFLALGLLAIEYERWGRAAIALGIFALFKESLGAYVVALGGYALYRAYLTLDPVRRRGALRFGAGAIVLGGIWFVLVNRVFMPALIARGAPPEPHETFGDFGPTVFQAAIGMLTSPMKAIAGLFVPGDKIASQLVTLGNYGFVSSLAPELLLPAAPLVAERFLSSKGTMWEMGYHYACSLSLYGGWAAAIGLSRLPRTVRREWALAAYVAASLLLTNEHGYRHATNYHRWNADYFATPERQVNHRAAIAFLEAHAGRHGRLAVQNRILPHFADREVIYRIGEHQKADWVFLSIGESAWPWDDGFPARLARELLASPDQRLVFAQGGTLVFARRSVAGDLPAVPVPRGIGL